MNRNTCKTTHGFTLIELLVVIAIIAVLLAILMPSLRIVKDIAKRITCSSNLRSLTAAAMLYAEDNDGRTPSSTYRWQDSNGTWRGGWVGLTADGSHKPLPTQIQIFGNGTDLYTGLRNGQLWNYIETIKAWRCPSDPEKEQLRSYGMAAEWWGAHTDPVDDSVLDSPPGMACRKISDIKLASERFMFIDGLGYMRDAFFAIKYDNEWWNIPNISHGGGSVNGFSDGHVEQYKMGAETIENVNNSSVTGGYRMTPPTPTTPDGINDLKYYQRGTWGNIGSGW